MNERIRELAEQAKLKTELWNNPEPFIIYKEDVNYPGGLEKFAELIVQECIRTIQMGITRDGHNTEKYLRSMKHLKDIREHFGVEE